MATYTVRDKESGKTVRFNWKWSQPPTESDYDEVFSAAGLRDKQPASTQPEQPPPEQQPEEADDSFSLMRMIANIPDDAIETARSTLYPLTNFKEFKQGLYAIATDPEARSQVWKELKNQYSHPLKYAEEKPVQAGMDVAGIASAIGLLGKIPQLGKVGQIASTVGKAGDIMNPASMPGHIVGGTRKLMSKAGVPEKLYESAMKIPPGSLKESQRERVLKTMIRDEKIPLKAKGADKITRIVARLDNDVTKALEGIKGGTVDIKAVTSRLDGLKKKRDLYQNRPDAQPYMDAIDEVRDNFINHAFVNEGKITLADANLLKKGAYKEVDSWYKKGQKPETGRVGLMNDAQAKATAEAAAALRDAILDSPDVPAPVKEWMKREAGLMNARKWVERATNRTGNLDMINLSGMIFGQLIDKGVPGAIAWKIVSAPGMKSRLAIRIANGSENLRKMGVIVKPGTLGTFQAGRLAEQAEVPVE